MVNPRQRSKKRSGSYKPVRHSRHAKKNLRKQPPIRGPKVLQDSWDKHKTVKQNYDALGLVAMLKPNESGGTEHNRYGGLEDETSPSTSTGGDPKGVPALSPRAKIPAGYGRIVRDEQGNTVEIELAEEDDETMDTTDRNVLTMKDMDHAYLDEKSASTWTQLGPREATRTRRPNSDKRGAPRFLSEGEFGYLIRLVARYGEDVEAMARDRGLNPDQRTVGELTRLVRKAGG
ncbi:hypothetical protein BDM02DRAFT_3074501, partial [Thelephora ganbajun]